MKKLNFILTCWMGLCLLAVCCTSCSDDKKLKLIPVKSGDQWGYINKKGEYVINPQFEAADFFRDGLALVKSSNGKVGFINKNGEYVIPAEYKDATHFADGLAFVVSDGGYPTCINKSGKTKFQLKQAKYVSNFAEGLACFVAKDEEGKSKVGFVNKSGEVVINPQFDNAELFSEGLAAVKQGDRWGFIDKSGNIVINPQFDKVGKFKNKKAPFRLGKQWGFIDKKGGYVINPQFEYADVFSEGLAVIRSGSGFGYITENGKMEINPQFLAAESFQNGMALVNQGLRFGYINKKGKIEINPQFDRASSFFGDIAFVWNGDKWGIIDKKGKYVVNPQFDRMHDEMGTVVFVESDFYDASEFVAKFFERAGDNNSFDGFSAESTLQSIVDNATYGDYLRANDKYIADCYNRQKMTQEISMDKVSFYFTNPIYDAKTTYSSYWGYRYASGTTKQYKFSEKIDAIGYRFDLSGDAMGKGSAVANALKKEVESRYGVEMKSLNERYASYSENGLSFGIEYKKSFVTLYIGFNTEKMKNLLGELSKDHDDTEDSEDSEGVEALTASLEELERLVEDIDL